MSEHTFNTVSFLPIEITDNGFAACGPIVMLSAREAGQTETLSAPPPRARGLARTKQMFQEQWDAVFKTQNQK